MNVITRIVIDVYNYTVLIYWTWYYPGVSAYSSTSSSARDTYRFPSSFRCYASISIIISSRPRRLTSILFPLMLTEVPFWTVCGCMGSSEVGLVSGLGCIIIASPYSDVRVSLLLPLLSFGTCLRGWALPGKVSYRDLSGAFYVLSVVNLH